MNENLPHLCIELYKNQIGKLNISTPLNDNRVFNGRRMVIAVKKVRVIMRVTWSNYWFWCGVLTLVALLLFGLIILTRAYKVKQEYLLSKNI